MSKWNKPTKKITNKTPKHPKPVCNLWPRNWNLNLFCVVTDTIDLIIYNKKEFTSRGSGSWHMEPTQGLHDVSTRSGRWPGWGRARESKTLDWQAQACVGFYFASPVFLRWVLLTYCTGWPQTPGLSGEEIPGTCCCTKTNQFMHIHFAKVPSLNSAALRIKNLTHSSYWTHSSHSPILNEKRRDTV